MIYIQGFISGLEIEQLLLLISSGGSDVGVYLCHSSTYPGTKLTLLANCPAKEMDQEMIGRGDQKGPGGVVSLLNLSCEWRVDILNTYQHLYIYIHSSSRRRCSQWGYWGERLLDGVWLIIPRLSMGGPDKSRIQKRKKEKTEDALTRRP